jgi:hypothetical protein
MRLLAKGEPFYEIPSNDVNQAPTFSESFLYPRVGKEDARFILAVAQEYGYLIDFLGTPAIVALLEQAKTKIKPPDLPF